MESIASSTVDSTAEQPATETPNPGNRYGLLIAGTLGLAIGGYVIFSERLDLAIGNSSQFKNLLVMIGMGPKAGPKRFIAPTVGAGIIALLALSKLSGGGRDAVQTKEQSVKNKKDQAAKPKDDKDAVKAEPEDQECNLSSYKMFQSLKDQEVAAQVDSAASSDRKPATSPGSSSKNTTKVTDLFAASN